MDEEEQAQAPGRAPVPKVAESVPAETEVRDLAEALAAVEARAAAELVRVYRALPGVVADLIHGATITDVQATYAAAQRVYQDVRQVVLRDQGAALPAAHSGEGAPPPPADPFEMIRAGVSVERK